MCLDYRHRQPVVCWCLRVRVPIFKRTSTDPQQIGNTSKNARARAKLSRLALNIHFIKQTLHVWNRTHGSSSSAQGGLKCFSLQLPLVASEGFRHEYINNIFIKYVCLDRGFSCACVTEVVKVTRISFKNTLCKL